MDRDDAFLAGPYDLPTSGLSRTFDDHSRLTVLVHPTSPQAQRSFVSLGFILKQFPFGHLLQRYWQSATCHQSATHHLAIYRCTLMCTGSSHVLAATEALIAGAGQYKYLQHVCQQCPEMSL